MDEIRKYDNLNESYRIVLSCGSRCFLCCTTWFYLLSLWKKSSISVVTQNDEVFAMLYNVALTVEFVDKDLTELLSSTLVCRM